MIENPSQGIKKYSTDDVYTPGDSNSRRERAQYDFVITQEQLASRVGWLGSQDEDTSVLDLGEIILSNADGSTGPALSTLLDHPISIYIDAQAEGIVFDLAGSLFSTKIFTSGTVSAAQGGYNGGTLVHIYSRTGYSIPQASVCGAIALHSRPEAPVSIISSGSAPAAGCGWNGIFKVGTCKVLGTDINLYSRPGWLAGYPGLTVVYEKCLEGRIVWDDTSSSPLANTYEPGVVCAPWMSPAVDTWLDTAEGSWVNSQSSPGKKHWCGLTYKIDQALRYGSAPKLRIATTSQGTLCLPLSAQKGTVLGGDVQYTFSNGYKTATVDAVDDIVLGNVSTSGSHAIIADFDVKRDVPTVGGEFDFDLVSGLSKCTILREGGDFEALSNQDWTTALDLSSCSTLDWYLWYAYHGHITEGSTAAAFEWVSNTRTQRILDAATFTEGKVYEINIHIVALPSGGPYVTEDITWGEWASPVTKLVNGTSLDQEALSNWVNLIFRDGQSNASVSYWGGTAANSAMVSPDFRAPAANSVGPYRSARTMWELTELAVAKVQFVKLDGKVYIMAY